MKFICSTCGKEHDLDGISFGKDRPLQWYLLTDEERQASELTPDQCIINSRDGRSYFVRACLDIPIRGSDKVFTWGVWVSLREQNFDEMHENWNNPDRVRLGPYFGWLCTTIPVYPDTAFLKTNVHYRKVGLHPTVELQPTDHPLAVHQRDGISKDELEAIIKKLLHDVPLSES